MDKTLSIIIPVFNEKDTVEGVLEAVRQSKIEIQKEIIVVDDCSNDGTGETLKNMNGNDLRVFFNKRNSGKGYSVRRGLSEAKGDFIIIQDADLEYDPNEYSRLVQPLIEGKADVVYGSRFLNRKFSFKSYYLANKFLTFLSNTLTGLCLTDMETCYKCFTRKALQMVLPSLSADRFEIEPEITFAAAKAGLKIVDVPISYYRRSYAEGKKIGWKDGVEAVYSIIKYGL